MRSLAGIPDPGPAAMKPMDTPARQPLSTPVPLPEPAEASSSRHGSSALAHVAQVRELFWHNVVREMLMGLSVMSLQRSRLPGIEAQRIDAPEGSVQTADPEADDMFDGRLAIITALGQRVPIADVQPLFGCSINTDDASRALSADVQCSVFRIETPNGETYTLPIHEIRGMHSISPELLQRVEAAAEAQQTRRGDPKRPFGFAAFTKTQSQDASDLYYPPE
ncbi:MAG: hypothetical protein EA378_01455 [Phycisphaerales bacterium]|nr:MAG: hypothetical protein EA378_01455 [Phycisphaerales bacterium]